MNLKGPWEVPNANLFRVVAPDMKHQNKKEGMCPPYPWAVIADTDPESVGGETAAALARAIASMPDLVEACRKALVALDHDGSKGEATSALRRALARAGIPETEAVPR